MRIFIFSLFIFILNICILWAQEPVLDSVKIQGQMRRYWLLMPEGIQKDAPLVFALNGYGNPGKKDTWMNESAKKHKFALCIPCGWIDPAGKPSWNVGYPFQKGWKVDDVKSMCTLAKYLQKKHHLSKQNTFLTGMSNGGEMCYLLAYSKQNVFKAFGSLSGLTMEWIYNSMEAPHPVPIFEIHGRADHTSEWTGNIPNSTKWGAYMSTPVSIGYWIARNKCEIEKTDTIPSMNPGSNRVIIKHKYSGGPTGCEVWLYEVLNGPHSWFEKDINIGEEVWSFFSKYIQ